MNSLHQTSVPIDEVATALGLPPQKVALMLQTIRTHGMDDVTMASMMTTALAKGLDAQTIFTLLSSAGIQSARILTMLRAQDALQDAASVEKLAKLEAQVQAQAQAQIQPQLRTQASREADTSSHVSASISEDTRSVTTNITQWHTWLKKAGIVVFWLIVWQVLDTMMDNRLILAGPIRTIQALAEQALKPDFWFIALASTARIAAGFLLSFVTGILLSLATYKSHLVRDFIEPLMSCLRTVPVVSIIIMLLIWFGNQMLTVYLSFCLVLPLMYTNMLAGLCNTDSAMLEMARSYNLSHWKTFLYIYRPAFMPFLTSTSKLSLGMSWKAGIMAEVLATPKPSIGKELAQARTYLNTPNLFAWTVVVMLLSWVFDKLFMELLHKASGSLGSLLVLPSKGYTSTKSSSVTQEAVTLTLDKLNKSFGTLRVLTNLSWTLRAGESWCLMGPSGVGKTTLLRIMLGLEHANAGSVICTTPKPTVSMVFQEDRLCPALTPIQNLALVMPHKVSATQLQDLLLQVLPKECLTKPVMYLSGGQRRRVALARAMAYPSQLIIMDEPFTGLDVATKQCVIEFIKRHKNGRTLLISTHGMDDAQLLEAQVKHLTST